MRLTPICAIVAGVALTSACANHVEEVGTERSTTVFEEEAANYVSNLSVNPPRECGDTIVTVNGTTRFSNQRIYLAGPEQSVSTFLADVDDFVIESLPLSTPRTEEEVHYIVGSVLEDGSLQSIAHITVDERGCLE